MREHVITETQATIDEAKRETENRALRRELRSIAMAGEINREARRRAARATRKRGRGFTR
jgi:hypothetical protein